MNDTEWKTEAEQAKEKFDSLRRKKDGFIYARDLECFRKHLISDSRASENKTGHFDGVEVKQEHYLFRDGSAISLRDADQAEHSATIFVADKIPTAWVLWIARNSGVTSKAREYLGFALSKNHKRLIDVHYELRLLLREKNCNSYALNEAMCFCANFITNVF